eukprot:CAMPEP_0179337944 /NCGR_PEP_ID=MMETSP0797-20121207/67912_1 /TAXON_ID=47934 /ORGANISM="Dinophysis acuminata, Strain DAEP01" /LENGTH=52 /DNA_ID=CAMNT_0021051663 /DNA_START=51 /DNA_END=205 /DNA_ORIENTATION=-
MVVSPWGTSRAHTHTRLDLPSCIGGAPEKMDDGASTCTWLGRFHHLGPAPRR